MKYYVDDKNAIFAYESDGSQDYLIGDKRLVTEEECEQIVAKRNLDEFEALPYTTKRRQSYPPFNDFLDAWVKNDTTALEEYRSKCLEVKRKFPKPE